MITIKKEAPTNDDMMNQTTTTTTRTTTPITPKRSSSSSIDDEHRKQIKSQHIEHPKQQQQRHQQEVENEEEDNDDDDQQLNTTAISPAPSTVSSNGSVTSSALSLAIKNDVCPDPSTIVSSLIQHQQHQHEKQHQQFLQQHQLQEQFKEEKQRKLAQMQLDELQTHHQMTANLFMARTIALSTSRDLPEMLQAAANAGNGNSYLLPCPLCETPLEPRLFRQHLDRHYPRDSPVCPVLQCGRRFAHPNSVRNHMRIKHTIQWAKMKAMRSSGGPFTGIPDYK